MTDVDPEGLILEPHEDDNIQGIDSFFERNIPQIMRNSGWNKAAKFLERWLNGEAMELKGGLNPSEEGNDFKINPRIQSVGMDWILQDSIAKNDRAQNAFDKLKDPDYFLSEKAQDVLEGQLRDSLATQSEIELGDLEAKGEDLHRQHIQNSPIEGGAGLKAPLDPLTGAMGQFSFYGIPVGGATKDGDTVAVEVRGVGVYALDSFNFNGFQVLGSWKPPDRVSKIPCPRYYTAMNGRFRKYREMTGLGEDFLTMSNVREITFSEPITFSFTI